ncbi:hypothetical protein GJ744_010292 [Endocarpon pusillum]|uniref:Uncharacterized protein n=1 Tax=Endocarpon pusillum TaxID=364733 RepID=A0A8H7AIH9_9EURO|nr:hypothetical protein GJ744_010292 [Endocarpon pusillum]
MTDSENDNLPFTPESFADRDIGGPEDGIFAWLRPHSPTALAAFDAVVNASIKYPERYNHIRQYIFTKDHRDQRTSSIYSEDGEVEESPSRQWSGAFKLSMKSSAPRPGERVVFG